MVLPKRGGICRASREAWIGSAGSVALRPANSAGRGRARAGKLDSRFPEDLRGKNGRSGRAALDSRSGTAVPGRFVSRWELGVGLPEITHRGVEGVKEGIKNAGLKPGATVPALAAN